MEDKQESEGLGTSHNTNDTSVKTEKMCGNEQLIL